MGKCLLANSFGATAAILMFTYSAAHASSMPTRVIELAAQQLDDLERIACFGESQSIGVKRLLFEPYSDYAEVQCSPHSTYQGHPVARYVRCSRLTQDVPWTCDAGFLTVEARAAGRTILVRQHFATAQDALDVIAYLLSGPSKGELKINADWITSEVWVYRWGDRFSVAASRYHFAITREQSAGVSKFELTGVSSCEIDTCHPIT